MPTCPRCGKDLCTNQALDYHLNKKTKCIDNSCRYCKGVFETRSKRDSHVIYCRANVIYKELYKMYTNVFILNENHYILKCSNDKLIDTKYMYEIHASPFSKSVRRSKEGTFSVEVTFIDDMVIVKEELLTTKQS